MAELNMSRHGTSMFLAIQLGDLRLLVPQEDVSTVESATDIRIPTSKFGAFGSIRIGRERLPVYCLSESLGELRADLGSRRICPILAGRDGNYGVLCDEVELIPADQLDGKALPPAMRGESVAIGGLAIHEEHLVCVSSADALFNTIQRLIDERLADKAVA